MLLVMMPALQFSFKGTAYMLETYFSISCRLLSDLCRLQLLQLRMQRKVHSSIGFNSELGKICGQIKKKKKTYNNLIAFLCWFLQVTSANEILIDPTFKRRRKVKKNKGQVLRQITIPYFRGKINRAVYKQNFFPSHYWRKGLQLFSTSMVLC